MTPPTRMKAPAKRSRPSQITASRAIVKPNDFNSVARKGGVNICAKASTASSIIALS